MDVPFLFRGLGRCARTIRAHPHRIALLVFTGVLAVIFADPLTNPRALIANHPESDMVHMWAPYKAYLYHQFHQIGRVPLWCPVNHGGWPIIGHPEMGLFYPPFWAFLVSDSPWVFSLELIGHLWLGGIAMYALGVRHRFTPTAALVSALTFALATPILARIYAGHLNVVCEVALFPLAFLAFEVLQTRGYRFSPVMGLVLASIVLPGHLQFPYYLILVLTAWALMRFGEVIASDGTQGREKTGPVASEPSGRTRPARSLSWRAVHRGLGPWLLTCGIAAGLAAPQLLSTAEMAGYFVRRGGLGMSDALGASYWFPSELPYVLASPEASGPIAHRPGISGVLHYVHWEGCLYVGLLPLGLALAAVSDRERRRRLRPYWMIAAAALLFVCGPAGGLFWVVYRIIPGAALFRVPTRAGTVFVPCVAVLAGAGMDSLREAHRSGVLSDRTYRRALATGGLLLAIFTVVFLSARTSWGRSSGLLAAVESLRGPFRAPRRALVVRTLWHTSAVPLLAACAAWSLMPFNGSLKAWAAVALVAIDLGIAGRPLVRTAAVHPGRFTAPFDEILRTESRPLRIYSIGDRPDEPGGYAWDGMPTAWQAVAGGLQLANGDLTLRLQEWDDLLTTRGVSPAGLTRLGLLNVRYVVSSRPLPETPDLSLVAAVAGVDSGGGQPPRTIRLYRNRLCLPRAWVVPDARVIPDRSRALDELGRIDARRVVLLEEPTRGAPNWMASPGVGRAQAASDEVCVEYRTPEHLVLRARTDGPAYLVISDPWYPGWRAWDNGRPVPVLRGDAALRCIPLGGAGEHTVEVRYRPTWLRLGLLLMALTVAVGVGIMRVGRRASFGRSASLSWGVQELLEILVVPTLRPRHTRAASGAEGPPPACHRWHRFSRGETHESETVGPDRGCRPVHRHQLAGRWRGQASYS